jgi:hypothetical protein
VAGLILASAAVAAEAPINVGGGDGSTIGQAIIIDGATDEEQVNQTEKLVLNLRFPGWSFESQRELQINGKILDAVSITKSGNTQEIFFNITSSKNGE